MKKVVISANNNYIEFGYKNSKTKTDDLNMTSVIDFEKVIFTEDYILERLDLIVSYMTTVVIKKNIDKVLINDEELMPLILKIINNIPHLKKIIIDDDKQLSFDSYELLLENEYIEYLNCYSMQAFMFDRLSINRKIKIDLKSEVSNVTELMKENDLDTHSKIFYKRSIDIKKELDEAAKDDLRTIFGINEKLKSINIYHFSPQTIKVILDLAEEKKITDMEIKIFESSENADNIRSSLDFLREKNESILKQNDITLTIKQTKEFLFKNIFKQLNMTMVKALFVIIVLVVSLTFLSEAYHEYAATREAESINRILEERFEENPNLEDEYLEEETDEDAEEAEDSESNQNQGSNNNGQNETNDQPAYVSPYYRDYSRAITELKEINSDTVGYISVRNTNISYPVVQASDNDFYLTRTFTKSNNPNGWIYMDYRNNSRSLDDNTIIYGHNSRSIMFGQLEKVFTEEYYTNKSNQVLTFNNETSEMKWQIFSIYKIMETNDYLHVNFQNDAQFNTYVNMVIDRSIHNFGVSVNPGDNILTLSTCDRDNTYRLVVHAKLIK